jgi:DNA invertase Pin-like site-specific DNA recombinase
VTIFEHKGETLAIIDGELWLKLPQAGTAPISETASEPKKRGRKPGFGMKATQDKIKAYKLRSGLQEARVARIEPEDMKQIKEMVNAGYGAQDIATKFNVKVQYIYNIKMRMKKDGELIEDDPAS